MDYLEMGKGLLIQEIIKIELDLEFEQEFVETKEEYIKERTEFLEKQPIYYIVETYAQCTELMWK